jgi:hypothetical protein
VAHPGTDPGRGILALLAAVLLLGGAAVGESRAGIIELGLKGQKSTGSTFRVTIDGQDFDPNSHFATEDVALIAEDVRAKIDASPLYIATIPDPNNPTLITVVRELGVTPVALSVFIQDGGIGGTFVDQGGSPGTSATLNGVDAVAGNGNFEVDITYVCEGMPPTVDTQIVSTAGKSRDEVNAAMVAALTANGFTVTGPANGPYTITQPTSHIQRIEMKRTDTGITVSGVGVMSTASASAAIPTLSEWGLVALALLLGAVAVPLIRRRARGSI